MARLYGLIRRYGELCWHSVYLVYLRRGIRDGAYNASVPDKG
jgi:hypothetical protein